MFGYATNEMDNYMPIPIELSHIILQELADIRKKGEQMQYLRPDSKSQVTVEYNDNGIAQKIDTIVISTQHDDFIKPVNNTEQAIKEADTAMHDKITEDIKQILLPKVKATLPDRIQKLFKNDLKLFVNPTGKFVIGGPHGDTGLTGRKIIIDTYGGKAAHGGGAFSGKDASKMDRSAGYATRHIAKNMVAAGVADEILIQVAYAIGIAQPVGLYVNTFGTAKVKNANGQILSDSEIADRISKIFDMRPYAIIERFGLKNPIFQPTATYGHFGRDPYNKEVEIYYLDKNGKPNEHHSSYKTVEFFAWEKLDYVDKIKKEFNI